MRRNKDKVPNCRLTIGEFEQFIRNFSDTNNGSFCIALVKDAGQEYCVVLYTNSNPQRVRIAIKNGSHWNARDVIEDVFALNREFDAVTQGIVNNTLMAYLGHAIIIVHDSKIVTVRYVEGNVWP